MPDGVLDCLQEHAYGLLRVSRWLGHAGVDSALFALRGASKKGVLTTPLLSNSRMVRCMVIAILEWIEYDL